MTKNLRIGRTIHTVGKTMSGYAIPTCKINGRGWYSTSGRDNTATRTIDPVTCRKCN